MELYERFVELRKRENLSQKNWPKYLIFQGKLFQNGKAGIEMWRLRERAKTVAGETVLMDIVYQYY